MAGVDVLACAGMMTPMIEWDCGASNHRLSRLEWGDNNTKVSGPHVGCNTVLIFIRQVLE